MRYLAVACVLAMLACVCGCEVLDAFRDTETAEFAE